MEILRDVPIELTAEQVLEAQYSRRQRPNKPWLVEVAQQAIDMSRSLVAPAAIYGEFAVQRLEEERVIVSSNGSGIQPLTIGPKVDLLAPAAQVMVAVYTIGPALERRVDELNRSGEAALAYMLDAVGVMALGEVGEALRVLTEERASARDWGVGPALSPGSLVGYALTGQRELSALLPLGEIDVQLSPQCVLIPHKSVSMVIGMGPEYETGHVGSVCGFCSLADHCWRRREDQT
jgi:uncharacterized membrane protein YgdD (TMEM256/DUF423 family)